jgi:hypothetical protein
MKSRYLTTILTTILLLSMEQNSAAQQKPAFNDLTAEEA